MAKEGLTDLHAKDDEGFLRLEPELCGGQVVGAGHTDQLPEEHLQNIDSSSVQAA